MLAEGVESQRHIERLLSLGCEGGQGYFLHEPLDVHGCSVLLEQAAQRAASMH